VNEKASFLAGPSESSAAARLGKILAVFGVSHTPMTVEEFLSSAGSEKIRLFCTAAAFLELMAALEKIPNRRNKFIPHLSLRMTTRFPSSNWRELSRTTVRRPWFR